jgi:uncharacterized protein (DUF2141 family)
MKDLLKIIILFISLSPLILYSQEELVVEVTGIKAIQGDLYLSLYDNDSSWLFTDSAFHLVSAPVKNNSGIFVLKGIPYGLYAIAVYQDQNANGILDETEMKIPKEPYGFSNNPKGKRGPASYQDALINFGGKDTLRIELVNNLFTPNKEKHDKKK